MFGYHYPLLLVNFRLSHRGTIASKDTRLDLYNLFVQVDVLEYDEENPIINKLYVVSIGNQNSSGLEIE